MNELVAAPLLPSDSRRGSGGRRYAYDTKGERARHVGHCDDHYGVAWRAMNNLGAMCAAAPPPHVEMWKGREAMKERKRRRRRRRRLQPKLQMSGDVFKLSGGEMRGERGDLLHAPICLSSLLCLRHSVLFRGASEKQRNREGERVRQREREREREHRTCLEPLVPR